MITSDLIWETREPEPTRCEWCLRNDTEAEPVCRECAEYHVAWLAEQHAVEVTAVMLGGVVARMVLPFGVEHPDDLLLPFCACGRVWSQCDGSRRGCRASRRAA